MERSTVMNVTDTPLVIDEEGHVLGGGEVGKLNLEDPIVASHIEGGRLVAPTPAEQAPEAKKTQPKGRG